MGPSYLDSQKSSNRPQSRRVPLLANPYFVADIYIPEVVRDLAIAFTASTHSLTRSNIRALHWARTQARSLHPPG